MSRCVCVCERSEWHARLSVVVANARVSVLTVFFLFIVRIFFFIAYACKNLGDIVIFKN